MGNVLRTVFVILACLAVLAFGAWLVHEHGKRAGSLTDAAAAAFHQAQAERYLSQRDAALEAAREAGRRDSLAVVREDSLARASAEKDRRNAALAADLRTAQAHVDELTGRFRDTGDCDDCAAALDAHVAERAQAARVIGGLQESGATKTELLLAKDERIRNLSVRGDSAIAALRYTELAYDEQEARALVFQRQAHRYRSQRNAVLVGGGLILAGVLIFK